MNRFEKGVKAVDENIENIIKRLELLESAVNNLTSNLVSEPLESSQEEEQKLSDKEIIDNLIKRYDEERII